MQLCEVLSVTIYNNKNSSVAFLTLKDLKTGEIFIGRIDPKNLKSDALKERNLFISKSDTPLDKKKAYYQYNSKTYPLVEKIFVDQFDLEKVETVTDYCP